MYIKQYPNRISIRGTVYSIPFYLHYFFLSLPLQAIYVTVYASFIDTSHAN